MSEYVKVVKTDKCESCGKPLSAALQSVGIGKCGPCRGVIRITQNKNDSKNKEAIRRHSRAEPGSGYGRDGYIGDVGGYD